MVQPAYALNALEVLNLSTGGEFIFGSRGYKGLLSGLTNGNPEVRVRAIMYLSAAETNVDVMVPILLQCFNDPAAEVRQRAFFELFKPAYNAKGTDLIPDCIRMLSDGDSMVKGLAAIRLSDFGNAATNALPTLVRLFKEDADPHVRKKASIAIQKIGVKSQ